MPKPGLIADLPNWIPLEAWAGWLEMRKAKKVPTTDRAIVLAIRKLDELRRKGFDPEAVVDQSTLRGWTSFYEIRDERGRFVYGTGKQAAIEAANVNAGTSWLERTGDAKH